MKRSFIAYLFFLCWVLVSCEQSANNGELQKPPNIVIIYVDDLGYGDLSCYGATDIQTPNIDRMAAKGIRFTDAHSASSVCAPSRYALISGKYPFRRNQEEKYQRAEGDTDPMMIMPGTATLPSILKEAGYSTGVVGKWHLGLGSGKVNWNERISPGPSEIGFDYSFLIPVTGDRVPAVFVENQEVVNLDPQDPIEILFIDTHDEALGDPNPFPDPTGLSNPELLKQKPDYQHSGTIVNGISRIGFMTGGNAARFKEEEFPFILKDKAVNFIEKNKSKPFFLYFNFHDIHVARLPHENFAGKSPMGVRGDAILQVDWVTGELMKALEAAGVAENTLIIFSSDNGPVLYDGYEDSSVELLGNHTPAGPLRGAKYSVYEGGNRVPTIAYWPSQIQPKVSDALWCQVDLTRSLARLANTKVPAGHAYDSKDVLDVLLGKADKGREYLIEQGSTYALRKGNWKYIVPKEKDVWWIKELRNTESGIMPTPQLYDLSKDLGEKTNLAEKYPALVAKMDSVFQSIFKEKNL